MRNLKSVFPDYYKTDIFSYILLVNCFEKKIISREWDTWFNGLRTKLADWLVKSILTGRL